MYGTAHDSPSTRFLLECISQRRTCRAITGTGPSEVSIWLIEGHLVAARSPEDSKLVVERLTRGGHLSELRSRQLQGTMVDQSSSRSQHDPMLALLADEVDAGVFERVMRDRFDENLCRFVAMHESPRMKPEEPPWCDNIQTGHESRQLVERCVLDWDTALALDDRRALTQGPAPAERDPERRALEATGQRRSTVAEIVGVLDLEPVAARVAVVRMIDRGVLADPPGEFYSRDGRPEARGRAPGHGDATYVRPGYGSTGGGAFDSVRDPRHAGGSAAHQASRAAPGSHGEAGRPPSLRHGASHYGAAGDNALRNGAAGDSALTHDAELEGFSGAMDNGRSGGVSDAYTTPPNRLDRVVIPEPPRENGADSAFAAPTLSNPDALAKLEVANDVLGNICQAIDQAKGAGRGTASLQLLVDARPRHFAPLVEGVKLHNTGALPVSVMIKNLRTRPPAEQRRLLNDCLTDLIDRALDKAADDLPEEILERLLQRVMGYRHRLGF